jgi:hypothetical protein
MDRQTDGLSAQNLRVWIKEHNEDGENLLDDCFVNRNGTGKKVRNAACYVVFLEILKRCRLARAEHART